MTIIDQDAFKKLIQQFTIKSPSTRVEASVAGDSHSHRVSGSLLTILFYQQDFPQLIVFDQDANYRINSQLSNKAHQHLLIIENLENFLALIQNPAHLDIWLDKHWDCDIVYASGNAINNKLHQKFFSQYDKIRCLLDIDSGGFKLFKSISKLVAENTLCEFVLSDDYVNKHKRYGRLYSNEDYIKLINSTYPQSLKKAYDLVIATKKFAEQEILLKS